MNLKNKLTAVAAGVAIATAGTVSAMGPMGPVGNLGEVWVGDQFNGLIYIADQARLDNPHSKAPVSVIDLTDQGGHASKRMHIIGFSNHAGLDPASRAVFSYLDGVFEIWNTNGGTHKPTKIVDLDTGAKSASGSGSLHMCGPSPDNTKIACSSIGGRQGVTYSADMTNDVYTRLANFRLNTTDLPYSSRLKGKAMSTVKKQMKAIEGQHPMPQGICNNFDTTSNVLYYSVGTSATSGGVIVLDVTDIANPTILDAWAIPFADGCGLVNSQDGNYMWINHGHNNAGDDEMVSKWDNNRYTGTDKITEVGPVATVDLPKKPELVNGRNGDVHGAQFAGIGGSFLWEIMRIDDLIHVIEPDSATLVNTIDLEAEMGIEAPQPDVLDRSALGSTMYFSTRGFIPTTAITGFIDLDRDPGIVTMKADLGGFSGSYMKTTSIRTGNTVHLCEDDGDDGDHDHDTAVLCEDQDNAPADPGYLGEVDTVDPHGLKSLSYATGGF